MSNFSDFALLSISAAQVQGTFTFSGTVNQIAMGSAFMGGGNNGRVAGWGATTTGGNPTNQLMFFATTTITNADCQSRFTARGEHRAASFVFAHKICTFTRQGQGICQGDSGGGLVVGTQVVGIVSWNIPCGQGVPDVFDRVASHRSWINSVTGL
jgi:secreted trypsin-like serine protease